MEQKAEGKKAPNIALGKNYRTEVPKIICRVWDVRKAPMVEIETLSPDVSEAMEAAAGIARGVFGKPEDYPNLKIMQHGEGHNIDFVVQAYQEAGVMTEETAEPEGDRS